MTRLPMLHLDLAVTDQEASELVAALPRFAAAVHYARTEALMRGCGIERHGDGVLEVPGDLAVVWALAVFIATGVLPVLVGIEFTAAEPPRFRIRWGS